MCVELSLMSVGHRKKTMRGSAQEEGLVRVVTGGSSW